MLRFVLVLVVLAVAVYATVRLMQAGGFEGLKNQPKRRPKPESRPQGPDDDDDFLRDLDRRRRHPDDPESPTTP